MSENVLLEALTREGVLISASVRYPRFTKRLKPEDLGLADDEVNQRLISLGHKKLLPRDALASLSLVESRVHALVERSSFAFLGVARFLPNAKLDDVQQGLEALNMEFNAARRVFLDEYDAHRVPPRFTWIPKRFLWRSQFRSCPRFSVAPHLQPHLFCSARVQWCHRLSRTSS